MHEPTVFKLITCFGDFYYTKMISSDLTKKPTVRKYFCITVDKKYYGEGGSDQESIDNLLEVIESEIIRNILPTDVFVSGG